MVAAVVPLETPALATERWPLWKRIGFRFGAVYLFLYCFPFPIGYLPWTDWPSERYQKLWWTISPWVGHHILGISGEIRVGPNGSGDTTADYITAFTLLLIAAIATIAWSALDRERPHYRRIGGLVRVYVRYTLAFTMITYGVAKLTQFPTPPDDWLLERYGDSSPMRLLWTFMGYSKPYCYFAGACEVLGGALLLSRRTTMIGSLFLLGVIGNVVMLNFCYDVPVKLYSSHLWLMALVLAAPDLPRVLAFFLRTAAPLGRRWLLVAKLALITGGVGYILHEEYKVYNEYGPGAPSAPHEGVWNVREPRPEWHRVYIGTWSWAVYDEHDARRRYGVERQDDGTYQLTSYETQEKFAVTITEHEDGTLTLIGPVTLDLERNTDTARYLMDRGFHWINEFPNNR